MGAPCKKILLIQSLLWLMAAEGFVAGQPRPGDVEPVDRLNLLQIASLQTCFTGPNNAPGFSPPTSHDCLPLFDLNLDSDIDLADFAMLGSRSDSDVDLRDVATLQLCFGQQKADCAISLGALDIDKDGDIDLHDYTFIRCAIGGPGNVVPAVSVNRPPTATASSQIQISGKSAGWPTVQILGGATTISAAVQNCAFTASIPLVSNRLNRLFLTGRRSDEVQSAPAAVSVLQDNEAPSLFIDFPTAGAELTTSSTDVAGRVGDMLSGFLGLTVRVNGNIAVVDVGIGNNGTFLASQVALTSGVNTITVFARDSLGNSLQKQIHVIRVEISPDAAQLHVVSGNGQHARIGELLANPIVVQVTSQKGLPLAGKLVTFDVIRSNGRLTSDGQGAGALILQAFTNDNGEAQAFLRLGSDAGCGNNRVEVKSVSVVGTTNFCASASPGVIAQINLGSGDNQRCEVNAAAPEPLRVWVSDSCNGGGNIPVTFMVTHGSGKVNGLPSVIVPTSETGHAEVAFTLGPQPGRNTVTADFPGNTGAPASFTVIGLKGNESEPTRFRGIVLDNASQPIQGATCILTVGGVTLPGVASDVDGQFEIDNIPGSGLADLLVYGDTAFHVGGLGGTDVPFSTFPSLQFLPLNVIPHVVNSLTGPVRLPPRVPNNVRHYSTLHDTELTVDGIDGLKMVVKAGSMKIRNSVDEYVPAPDGFPISLNQVHHDAVPMPIPDGAAPEFAWTLQPGGSHFNPPVSITYPNMDGLPAGAIANFLSFDHDTNKFEIVASGHVTADGQLIVTDPGAGISVSGWGCNCPPYSVTGSCDSCPAATADAVECCPPCDASNCESCQSGGCVRTCTGCQTCSDGQCVDACIACSTCINGQCVNNCPPCNICQSDGSCAYACITNCQTCENDSCVDACGPCEVCTADGTCDSLCLPCEVCQNGSCVVNCPPCQACLETIGGFGCANVCLACQTCQGGACVSTCGSSVCCGGAPGAGSCCSAASCQVLDGELKCIGP
ncbi:MAG: hypothetical protein HY287_02655 [Planctomycetes bacterium]|nr:hypothetical protein [Planctomycetota bacterium]